MTDVESLKKQLLEDLARLEHDQWAHIIEYASEHGDIESWGHWLKQADTKYENLTEQEKESDREWARKVLKIFEPSLKLIADLKEKLQDLQKHFPCPYCGETEYVHYSKRKKMWCCANCNDWIDYPQIVSKKRELEGRLSDIRKHVEKFNDVNLMHHSEIRGWIQELAVLLKEGKTQ